MNAILSNLGVRVAINERSEELECDENNKEWTSMDEEKL
jgi:hypothetical protein